MEHAEMVETGEEDCKYRGALMKAAANGDMDAQRELTWRYDVWVFLLMNGTHLCNAVAPCRYPTHLLQ